MICGASDVTFRSACSANANLPLMSYFGSDMGDTKAMKLDVAVLGGGFAGVYCAQTISKTRGLKVGLISEENYMVFQPMLPEVAGSAISPRHVVNPLRLLCKHAQILKGRVESIQWPRRILTLNAGPFSGNLEISYDHLVLALGAETDLSRIPGMPEHAFLMKNVGDAMFLRTTLLGRIEEASLEPRDGVKRRLLTFVVVGGGYSGVETAGHILDFFSSICRYYPNISKDEIQIHLIHGGDHLLPTLSRKLGEYSAKKLVKRGLKLQLNQRVKSVTANRVHLEDGTAIETNTVISTVGNAPHPLVTKFCADNHFETAKGLIVVEPTGQVKGQQTLWAAGDCAAFPHITGGLCPATAQFAYHEGILIAKNIARQIHGKKIAPFTYKGIGEMASIGHHEAVGDIFGFHFSGFIAWWMWRTVYLTKLPRIDRKIRVVLDWTLDLFFPRDLNHLSPRFSKPVKEIYLETGDVLFQKGEPAFSFYVVKSGALEIRDNGELIQRVAPGGYFGERALLEDGVWQHDGIATEPTNLVSIPASVFRSLVRGVGSLGNFFQKSATKYQSREIVQAIGQKLAPDLAAQPISRVMQRTVYSLSPDMAIRDALQIAHRHPRSSYPVVRSDGTLLGTVTREDFYEFLKRSDTRPETPLKQMPFANVPTVEAETKVSEVMQRFIRTGSNKVLVVDSGNHLQGIATVMDLMSEGADGKHDGINRS
jgi:NADH dehydrogenase